MRNRTEDKLIAPVPVEPAWPNDEARATVIQANQGAYHQHMKGFQERRSQVQTLAAEIKPLTDAVADAKRVLGEAQTRLDEKIHAQREAARIEHVEWNSAQGYAVACAALGAPIPPPDGELTHDAEGKAARWIETVAEQNAIEGARPL